MTKQMNKASWTKRSLSFLLAFFFFIGAFSVQNPGLAADKKYGRIIRDSVNVGSIPGDNYIFKLPKDWVVEVIESINQDGLLWHKIVSQNPYSPGATHQGYILEGYFNLLSDEEARAWEKNPVQPAVDGVTQQAQPQANADTQTQAAQAQAAALTTYGIGTVTNGGTNLREKPWGERLAILDRGTVLEVFSYPSGNTENDWYGVKYGNTYGYIQAPYFSVTTTGPIPSVSPTKPTVPYSELAVGFVKTTKGGANLRDRIEGDTLLQLKRNTTLPYTAKPTTRGRFDWYPVITAEGKRGYLRSDVVEVVNYDGSGGGGGSVPITPTYTPPADTSVIYGSLTVTKSNSNLRDAPGGTMFTQLKKGTTLSYYGAPVSAKGFTWYYVQAPDGRYGYLRNDVVSATPSIVTPTTPPSVTDPEEENKPPITTGYGTITLIMNNVNLRKTPNGVSYTQLKKGTTHNLTGYPVTSGRFTWYPIQYGNYSGYIRGDMATYSGGSVVPPVNPPTTTPGNYVKVTTVAVNLRNSPGGKTIGRVDKHSIWPMTGAAVQTKGYIWYPVTAKGMQGYLRGDVAYQMSAKEVEEYLSGGGVNPPVTPTNPPLTGQYIMMVNDNVPVMDTASSSGVTLDWFDKNFALPYNSTVSVAGQLWYNISYRGYSLWILGSNVRTITAAEYDKWINNNVTPAPTVLPSTPPTPVTPTDPGTTKPEATYKILRKGSKGDDVKKLQVALQGKGLYKGALDGVYGTGTVAAVKAYQKSVGLKQDGIAGPNTLHSIYGTVPPGTGPGTPVDPGDSSFPLYPVEKIDWFTGGIQGIWPRGATAKVKDVRTGYVFTLKRWAGGNHSDAEPLTAFDTAQLCKVYNVSDASQITNAASNGGWKRRPLWVTVGNRTFAASLYGVPHNYPDGDTIPNNNFNGQLCVHFTNSTGHNTTVVDGMHQDAIQEAYNAYWKK